MKILKGNIEVREEHDFSYKSPNHANRKWIDWDLEKINFVRSLYLNGFSDKDIAAACGNKSAPFSSNNLPIKLKSGFVESNPN